MALSRRHFFVLVTVITALGGLTTPMLYSSSVFSSSTEAATNAAAEAAAEAAYRSVSEEWRDHPHRYGPNGWDRALWTGGDPLELRDQPDVRRKRFAELPEYLQQLPVRTRHARIVPYGDDSLYADPFPFPGMAKEAAPVDLLNPQVLAALQQAHSSEDARRDENDDAAVARSGERSGGAARLETKKVASLVALTEPLDKIGGIRRTPNPLVVRRAVVPSREARLRGKLHETVQHYIVSVYVFPFNSTEAGLYTVVAPTTTTSPEGAAVPAGRRRKLLPSEVQLSAVEQERHLSGRRAKEFFAAGREADDVLSAVLLLNPTLRTEMAAVPVQEQQKQQQEEETGQAAAASASSNRPPDDVRQERPPHAAAATEDNGSGGGSVLFEGKVASAAVAAAGSASSSLDPTTPTSLDGSMMMILPDDPDKSNNHPSSAVHEHEQQQQQQQQPASRTSGSSPSVLPPSALALKFKSGSAAVLTEPVVLECTKHSLSVFAEEVPSTRLVIFMGYDTRSAANSQEALDLAFCYREFVTALPMRGNAELSSLAMFKHPLLGSSLLRRLFRISSSTSPRLPSQSHDAASERKVEMEASAKNTYVFANNHDQLARTKFVFVSHYHVLDQSFLSLKTKYAYTRQIQFEELEHILLYASTFPKMGNFFPTHSSSCPLTPRTVAEELADMPNAKSLLVQLLRRMFLRAYKELSASASDTPLHGEAEEDNRALLRDATRPTFLHWLKEHASSSVPHTQRRSEKVQPTNAQDDSFSVSSPPAPRRRRASSSSSTTTTEHLLPKPHPLDDLIERQLLSASKSFLHNSFLTTPLVLQRLSRWIELAFEILHHHAADAPSSPSATSRRRMQNQDEEEEDDRVAFQRFYQHVLTAPRLPWPKKEPPKDLKAARRVLRGNWVVRHTVEHPILTYYASQVNATAVALERLLPVLVAHVIPDIQPNFRFSQPFDYKRELADRFCSEPMWNLTGL